MANPEHLKALQSGAQTWRRWRKDHPNVRPDLSRAELAGANLSRANLTFAKLTGSNLNKADLQGTDLRGAKLQQTNLCETDLTQAKLTRAHLQQADLIGAKLCRADLRKANLKKADLLGADLTDADLREATLIAARLGGATITGVRMYGTLRDDWEIDEIKCDYLYWDPAGSQRTPSDRRFKMREFQTIYSDWPDILDHFESRAAQNGPVQTLVLKGRRDPEESAITPQYLSETIGPYLKAVSDLQVLINAYVDLPDSEVRIISIVCRDSVQVRMDGVSNLLAFIQDELAGWRRKNKDRLAKIARSLNQVEVSQKEAQIMAIRSMTVSNAFESKMLKAEAAKKQTEAKVLASQTRTIQRNIYEELEARLEKMFPFKWVSDKTLADFKRQALPLLQFLAESDFAD